MDGPVCSCGAAEVAQSCFPSPFLFPTQMSSRILLLTKGRVILADAKQSQAKFAIGLDSVVGVSVSGFKDGLFGLHLKEVSVTGGGGRGTGQSGSFRGQSDPLLCYFSVFLRHHPWAPRGTCCWSATT